MKQFLRKFIGFSMGPVIGAIISFITTPIVTRFVPPAEYGLASMFSVMLALMASFVFVGMDQSYTREYNECENKKSLFQTSLIIPLFMSLLLLLVSAIFPDYLSNILFENPNYHSEVVLFAVLMIFTVLERFILYSIRMSERAIEYSSFNIIVKIGILLLSIILIMFGKRDFLTVIYSTVFGQIIADVILIVRYYYLFDFRNFYLDKKLIKRMLHFGFPLMVSASLISFLNSLDRLFLRYYSDFEQIGIYSATLKIANVIGILKAAFTSFWLPLAYRWYAENRHIKHFNYISDVILFLMNLLFFLLVFFREVIVSILSSDYSQSVYIVGLLCLPQILFTLSETTTLGIVFSRKSYLNILVSLSSVIPNIVLNFLLTPSFGNRGAAIASAGAYFFFFASRTYFSNQTGFKMNVKCHYIIITIMFVCAIITSFDFNGQLLAIIALFLISLIVQIPTYKASWDIYKKSDEWDFS